MEKFKKITDKDISSRGVQALADKPNAAARYGVGGLSPADLKEWFDKLASFLARHINDITDILGSDKAAQYICIALGELGIGDLAALIKSFEDGTFANKVLKLAPPGATTDHETLQDVINELGKAISEHREETKNDADALDAAFTDGSISDKLKTGFSEGTITHTLRQALMHLYSDMVSKKIAYVADLLAGEAKAFAISKDGVQKMIRVSTIPYGNSIVERDADGLIHVAVTEKSTSGHAVNKGYVDETFATKELVALCARTLYVDKKFANSLELSLDPINFTLTIRLLNKEGAEISSDVVDLPLESMVVNATYADGTLTLVLQNGNTVDIDVSKIVSGLVPNSRTINGKKLEKDITLSASDVGAVPTTRTINNNPLSENITLGASDVGAYTKEEVKNIAAGKLNAHSGYGDYTYVYGVGNTGNQLMQVIRVGVTPNSLAHRDEKGRLSGAAPESDNHLTNKKYVDEKNTALDGRLIAAEEELAALNLIVGQTIITEAEVEDTFSARQTAGGLDIIDGLTTEVKKVVGNTVAKDGALVNATFGGIKSTGRNLLDVSGAKGQYGFVVTADNNTLTFSGTPSNNYCEFVKIVNPDWLQAGKTYCIYQSAGKDYGTGKPFIGITGATTKPDGTKSYFSTAAGDAKLTIEDGCSYSFTLSANGFTVGTPITPFSISFMVCEGNTVLPYEPHTEDATFTLAKSVELGKWDTLDVENNQIVRQTHTLDWANGISYGYQGVNVNNFTFSVSGAPLCVASQFVSNYYTYGANADKTIHMIASGASTIFVVQDASCKRINDDGSVDGEATRAAYKALFAKIGLQIAYQTAEVQSTEAVDCPTGYVAYNGGTERVVQGDVDNSAHGAECTVTQTYYVSYGGDT